MLKGDDAHNVFVKITIKNDIFSVFLIYCMKRGCTPMDNNVCFIDDCGSKIQYLTTAGDNNELEFCVLCGKQTGVRKDMRVDSRDYFIDCGGQLCRECFVALYPEATDRQKIDERF